MEVSGLRTNRPVTFFCPNKKMCSLRFKPSFLFDSFTLKKYPKPNKNKLNKNVSSLQATVTSPVVAHPSRSNEASSVPKRKSSTAVRKVISRLTRCCAYLGEDEPHARASDLDVDPESQVGGTGGQGGRPPYLPEDAMDSFSDIKKKCLSTGRLYEDPTFPANVSVLFRDGPLGQVVWKRPKDLTSKPYFFHDEATYFDMDQGLLGDCWFVASAVCLAASPHRQMLFRVVPKDQGFDDDYCGVFHFNFWQYGTWKEVIIDDRLPTVNNRLIYGSNKRQPNEFWCPLLEKAYAKLFRSYHAIHGGFMDEGLVDLTGGIGESIFLGFPDQEHLEKVVTSAHRMNSVIGATINLKNPKPGTREVLIDNGLYQGHAYSIIDVKEVQHHTGRVTLLHVRNPWGRGEWKGAWSDRSREWRSLSEKDRRATFRNRDDGEFWISMEDFMANFDYLCMSHLTPDAHSKEVSDNLHLTQWNVAEHYDSWVRGVSSGGPLKSFTSSKFWTNPQFKLSLSRASEPTAVIISLFEVNTPPVRTLGEVRIGFVVFQLKEGRQPSRISARNYYEFTPRLVATSKGFTIHREITRRFMMKPMDHVIVPCTQKEGQQAEFFLRIFSDKKIDAKPFNGDETEEETSPPAIDRTSPEVRTSILNPKIDREFDRLAGPSNVVDANDLVSLLKYTDDESDTQLSLETSRCLLGAATIKSKKGLATKNEVAELLKGLKRIKWVFRIVDSNKNKSVDKAELDVLLSILEFNPSDKIVDIIWKRYGGKRGRLSQEDFIQTWSKLNILSRSYQELDYLAKSYIKWQEWAEVGFA